jgi:hypothetical protein
MNCLTAQTQLRLRVSNLLGIPDSALLQKKRKGAPQPLPVMSEAVGTPANFLRNWTDVTALERRLVTAYAVSDVSTHGTDLWI